MRNLHFLFCMFAKLPGVDFSGTSLERGRFDYADLRNARFHDVRARRAEFWKANLGGTEFHDADLRDACFHGADLRDARMIGCNLDRAQFRNTLVRGLDLAGSLGIVTMVVESIDIGSDAEPQLLAGQEAREWLQRSANAPVPFPRRCAKDPLDRARG